MPCERSVREIIREIVRERGGNGRDVLWDGTAGGMAERVSDLIPAEDQMLD